MARAKSRRLNAAARARYKKKRAAQKAAEKIEKAAAKALAKAAEIAAKAAAPKRPPGRPIGELPPKTPAERHSARMDRGARMMRMPPDVMGYIMDLQQIQGHETMVAAVRYAVRKALGLH